MIRLINTTLSASSLARNAIQSISETSLFVRFFPSPVLAAVPSCVWQSVHPLRWGYFAMASATAMSREHAPLYQLSASRLRSLIGERAEVVAQRHSHLMIIHAHIFFWANVLFLAGLSTGMYNVSWLFASFWVLIAANGYSFYRRNAPPALVGATEQALRRWVFLLPILFLVSSFVFVFGTSVIQFGPLVSAAIVLIPALVIALTFGAIARCCRTSSEVGEKTFWIYLCILLPLLGPLAWLIWGEKRVPEA